MWYLQENNRVEPQGKKVMTRQLVDNVVWRKSDRSEVLVVCYLFVTIWSQSLLTKWLFRDEILSSSINGPWACIDTGQFQSFKPSPSRNIIYYNASLQGKQVSGTPYLNLGKIQVYVRHRRQSTSLTFKFTGYSDLNPNFFYKPINMLYRLRSIVYSATPKPILTQRMTVGYFCEKMPWSIYRV